MSDSPRYGPERGDSVLLVEASTKRWLCHQNFYDDREESDIEFFRFDHSPRIGTQHPKCWGHDRHTISHVLIARISSREFDALQATSRTHARSGLGELKSRYREVSPQGVAPSPQPT